jgi:hypothetical protein
VPKRAGGKAFYLRQCEKGRKTSQLLWFLPLDPKYGVT